MKTSILGLISILMFANVASAGLVYTGFGEDADCDKAASQATAAAQAVCRSAEPQSSCELVGEVVVTRSYDGSACDANVSAMGN